MKDLHGRMSTARGAIVAKYGAMENRRAALIARSYALPLESSPIRWKSLFNTRPTAVAHPKDIKTADFMTISVNAPQYPGDWPANGEHYAALSRNPLQHMVVLDPNPNGDIWTYSLSFGDTLIPEHQPDVSALEQSVAFVQMTNINSLANVIHPLPVSCLNAIAPGRIPGNVTTYFSGKHQGRHGFWVDGWVDAAFANYTRLRLEMAYYDNWPDQPRASTPLPANMNYTINLYRLVGGDWVHFVGQGIGGGGGALTDTITLQIDRPGYYALELYEVNNAPGALWIDINAYLSGYGPNLVHHAVTGIQDKLTTLNNITVHAASLMMSCKAPEIAANGLIASAQLGCEQSFTEYFGPRVYDRLVPLDDSYSGPYKDGTYGFLKPCDTRDLDPMPLVVRSSTHRITGMVCPLMAMGGWVIMAASVETTPVIGAPNAAVAFVTLCSSIEYTTTDQWVDTHLPQYTTEEFELAMEYLASLPQFHENKIHWAQITAFLRGAAKTGLAIAPGLLRALSAIGGRYGAIAGAAAAGAEGLNRVVNG